jgi:hypothetical protein
VNDIEKVLACPPKSFVGFADFRQVGKPDHVGGKLFVFARAKEWSSFARP